MYTTLMDPARLIASVYGGVAAGALYDLLRAAGLVFTRPWQRAVLDTVYWAAVGALLAATLLYTTGGRFRPFVLIGFAGGAAAYIFAVSRLIDVIFAKKRLH